MLFGRPRTQLGLLSYGTQPDVPSGVPDAMPFPPRSDTMHGMGTFGGLPPGRTNTMPIPGDETYAPLQTAPATAAPPKGFDYAAIEAAMLPQKPHQSKLGKTLEGIGEILGPALMAWSGNQAGANALTSRLADQRAEAERRVFETRKMLGQWQHEDWQDQNQSNLRASLPFTLGRSRYALDPQTGKVNMLQHEDADFAEYASSLGLEPGSPEWNSAAQDYILRGSGPAATANSNARDDHRTANNIRLEGVRQKNRMDYQSAGQSGRERLHGLPTYRDTHPLPGGRGRASGSAPTATGPNGQKVMWNGKAWVPAQ